MWSFVRHGLLASVVALLLGLVAPALVRPASADVTSISIDPTTGPVGQVVTVTGTLSPSSAYQIRWDSATGTLLGSGTSNGAGAMSRSVTIPAGASSVSHKIFLVQVSSAVTGDADFTITPNLTISPATGSIGQAVTVRGTGFAASDTGITVTFDGSTVTTTPAAPAVGANGSWTQSATFAVPAGTLPGAHIVDAFGAGTTAASVPDRTFNTPNLALDPTTGAGGTIVTVTGSGFQANETGIVVTWDGATIATTPASPVVDADGVWTATITVPLNASVGGAGHAVDARGSTTPAAQVPNQTFTVVTGIAINPVSGPMGTVITVTGTGFGASEYPIHVDWNGTMVRNQIRASSTGFWSTSFTVMGIPAGTYPVEAVGTPTNPPAQNFTVTPIINVGPSAGTDGTLVTVEGRGFQSGEGGIVVTWDGVPIATTPAAPTADVNGSWTATFNVPAGSAGGSHTVDAAGSTTVAADVPDRTFNVVGLTITPGTGAVGTTVTVDAIGFQANESGIVVTWDGTAIKTGITASAAGMWSANVTVPPAAGGEHTIGAYGSATAASSVTGQEFIVVPDIRLGAATGYVGKTLTVSGAGFAANESSIIVTWDGATLQNAPAANAQGSWTATVTIPPSAGGVHAITGSGNATAAPASQAFTVLANLSISPSTGKVGSTVTVNGTGFGAAETGIQVMWNGDSIKGSIVADDDGGWNTTFVVPAATAGDRTVDARGSTTLAGAVPDQTFTVVRGVLISPATGYSGKVVTITGSGFAGNAAISATFDGTAVVTSPQSVISTAAGDVSATFTVPGGTPGSHTVAITDGTSQATATFLITSSVSAGASSGVTGAKNTLTGTGFPPNTPVSFTYDGSPVATTPATVATDAGGGFSAAVAVPESTRGKHVIKISSGAAVMTTEFTVSPTVTISPASGAVESTVTVSGSGFSGEVPVVLTYDGYSLETTPKNIVTSKLGSFSATLKLPAGVGGEHTIQVADNVGPAQGKVTLKPKIIISNASGKIGDRIGIAGSGFTAKSPVTAKVDGSPVATDPSALVSDATGGISGYFNIPAGPAGNHTLSLADAVNTASASYSITPSLTSSASGGNVGSTVSLAGSGFAAGSRISITYDGAPVTMTPADVTSSAQGAFQAVVTIPPSKGGQHVLAAADSASHVLQTVFVMESAAPSVPVLASPATGSRMGVFGSQRPTMSWTPATDPSGVVYTLHVSKEPNFSTLVFEKTGLKNNSFTVEEQKALSRGMYYWRVKAVDLASNEGGWSQPFTFAVGFLPVWMPLWMFVVLVLLVLGFIGAVLYLLVFSKPA